MWLFCRVLDTLHFIPIRYLSVGFSLKYWNILKFGHGDCETSLLTLVTEYKVGTICNKLQFVFGSYT